MMKGDDGSFEMAMFYGLVWGIVTFLAIFLLDMWQTWGRIW